MGSHLRHSVLKNLPMSIHVFFFWIQIYMATDLKSVCGRKSSVGHLIKTKSGKMFLQQSSKGENSTKREINKTKSGKMFLQHSSKGENSTKRKIKQTDYDNYQEPNLNNDQAYYEDTS